MSQNEIVNLEATGKYRFSRKNIQRDVRNLSEIQWYRSFCTILLQWVLIVGSGVLTVNSGQYWLYPICAMFIATRMHALGVLVHDAAHFRLAQSAWINDFVSDFFCAHPLIGSTRLYREFHLDHHRYTNTDKDPEIITMHGRPEFTFPKSKRDLVILFLGDIFVWNAVKTSSMTSSVNVAANFFKPEVRGGISWDERFRYLAFLAISFGAVAYFDIWLPYVFLWLGAAGLAGGLFRLRMIAEHHAVPNDREINGTRTVLGNWFEKTFICPLNVNFHLEHHMFPSVPFYNLKKLHLRLMMEPEFARKAHLTKRYISGRDSVLAELTAK